MTALIVTIFLASLAGSLHCAGMCGAFMLFAIGAGDGKSQSGVWRLHAAYHIGRLVTYIAFGVLAGIVGATVEVGGALVGVQRGAAIAAALFMIVVGVIMLVRTRGVRVPQFPVPKALQALASRGYRVMSRRTPIVRALGTGLLTTLLPCGWLYMFVVAAAGTGAPLDAAVVMAVFWVGTLPVMVALGAGVRTLLGPMAKRAPLIAAVAIVAVGVLTIVNRAVMIEHTPEMFGSFSQSSSTLDATGELYCHDGS